MKQFTHAVVLALLSTSLLITFDQYFQRHSLQQTNLNTILGFLKSAATPDIAPTTEGSVQTAEPPASPFDASKRNFRQSVKSRVHAAGHVQGVTETIALYPMFPGAVSEVFVKRGQEVSQGTPLLEIEAARYQAAVELAEAEFQVALAAEQELIHGARDSEIEAARQQMMAAQATQQNSQVRWKRAELLWKQRAISEQDYDDVREQMLAAQANLIADQEKLETISAPPRDFELHMATAKVKAANAKLETAKIDLDDCTITAPSDGTVLGIDVHPGDWISPNQALAPIYYCDLTDALVLAEVAEHDALKVEPGQSVTVTCDADSLWDCPGKVIEVAPRMKPKRIVGGWAGERYESFTRRVWIKLQTRRKLPIGLPVEVMIDVVGN